MTNHLGNVLSVVTDNHLPVYVGGVLDHYVAQVVQAQDYYAFGAAMEGRSFSISSYRFGFQGMEKEGELYGDGNAYTTEFRLYDSRLGRWLSSDPVIHSHESPYIGLGNNPILYSDPRGREIWIGVIEEYYLSDEERKFQVNKQYRIVPISLNSDNIDAQKTRMALEYLMKNDRAGYLTEMVNSKERFLIVADPDKATKYGAGGQDNYDFDGIHYYRCFVSLRTVRISLDENGNPLGINSPAASVFIHELGHAYMDYLFASKYGEEVFTPQNGQGESVIVRVVDFEGKKFYNSTVSGNLSSEVKDALTSKGYIDVQSTIDNENLRYKNWLEFFATKIEVAYQGQVGEFRRDYYTSLPKTGEDVEKKTEDPTCSEDECTTD
jgi:RHS repeat-associated protein